MIWDLSNNLNAGEDLASTAKQPRAWRRELLTEKLLLPLLVGCWVPDFCAQWGSVDKGHTGAQGSQEFAHEPAVASHEACAPGNTHP